MSKTTTPGLGERIRHRRRQLGMKQAVLARRAGISPSYLCELETREGIAPSAAILQEIARALDTSVMRLLDLPVEPQLVVPSVLPSGLQRARVRYRMADDEVALLSTIEYRGRRPQSEEDWFFLLCAIRRSVDDREHLP